MSNYSKFENRILRFVLLFCLRFRNSQQLDQLLSGKSFQQSRIIFLNHAVHQVFFPFNDGGNFFLQSTFRDEFEDLNATFLADAVNTIGGLVFSGRIPPAIIMDDNRSGHQIDTDAPGFKTADEYPAGRVIVEPIDDFTAVSAGARQGRKVHLFLGQMFFHDADHVEILAVDHYLLPTVKGFGQKFLEKLPLSGLKLIVIIVAGFYRGRVVANLLEQGEQGEYVNVGYGLLAFS